MTRPDELGRLTNAQWERLQNLADDFHRACSTVRAEELENLDLRVYLSAAADFRDIALIELIKTHLEASWRLKLRFRIEDYLARYPELGGAGSLPTSLIYEEYRVRHRYGDRPELDSYRSRFPTQYPELCEWAAKEPPPAPRVEIPEATTPVQARENYTEPSPGRLPPAGGDVTAVGKDYRLLERLGEGAFSDVYRAESPGGVKVALKRLRYTVEKAEAQKELESLQLIKDKRHAYLLAIHDFWIYDNRLHVAMELVDGTLRSRLNQCKLRGEMGIPPQELLRYMKQTAEVLDYLHEERIVHRDIKPENILLLGRNVKLADLGLARLVEKVAASLTGAPGTPAYMAPELWERRPQPTFKSDIYALAVTYAELRLGRRIFQGGNIAEIMFSHKDGNPDLDPLGPAEKAVLLTAMARDPQQRHRNCELFVRELEEALWEDGVMDPPIPTPAGRLKWRPGDTIEGNIKLLRALDDDEWEGSTGAGTLLSLCCLSESTPEQRLEAIRSLQILSDLRHPHLLTPTGFWLRDTSGKVIRADFDNAKARSRLTLVISSELSMPNILARFSDQRLRGDGEIAAADILPYLRQVAAALDYINFPQPNRPEALMHCNLRPECILINPADDVVKVSDFRLARVLDGGVAKVELPEKRLRSGYAAPELWKQRLSNRSDQFSLAVVYYFLRTGRLVDELRATREALSQIEVTSPEVTLNLDGLSPGEKSVVAKALSYLPHNRFGSSLEFIMELEEAASRSTAATHSPPARAGKDTHRGIPVEDRLGTLQEVPPPAAPPPKPPTFAPPKPPPTPPPSPPRPPVGRPAAERGPGTIADLPGNESEDSGQWEIPSIVPEKPPADALLQTHISPGSATGLPPTAGLDTRRPQPPPWPAAAAPKPRKAPQILAALTLLALFSAAIAIGSYFLFRGGDKPNGGTPPSVADEITELIQQKDFSAAREKLDAHKGALGDKFALLERQLHEAVYDDCLANLDPGEWLDLLEQWKKDQAYIGVDARPAFEDRLKETVRNHYLREIGKELSPPRSDNDGIGVARRYLENFGGELRDRAVLTPEDLGRAWFDLHLEESIHPAAALAERVHGRLEHAALTELETAVAGDPIDPARVKARLRLIENSFPARVDDARQRIHTRIQQLLEKAGAELPDPEKKAAEILALAADAEQEKRTREVCEAFDRAFTQARMLADLGVASSAADEWRDRVVRAWIKLVDQFSAAKNYDRATQAADSIKRRLNDLSLSEKTLYQSAVAAIPVEPIRAAIAALQDAFAEGDLSRAAGVLSNDLKKLHGDPAKKKTVEERLQKWLTDNGRQPIERAEPGLTDKKAQELVQFVLALDAYGVQPNSFALLKAKAANFELRTDEDYDAALRVPRALYEARNAAGAPLKLKEPGDAEKAYLAIVDALKGSAAADLKTRLEAASNDANKLYAALFQLNKVRGKIAQVEYDRSRPLTGDAGQLDGLFRVHLSALCRLEMPKETPVVASKDLLRLLDDARQTVAEKNWREQHSLLAAVHAECQVRSDAKKADQQFLEALERLVVADAPGYPRYVAGLARFLGPERDLEKSTADFLAAFAAPKGKIDWLTRTRADDFYSGPAAARLASVLPEPALKDKFLAADAADKNFDWLQAAAALSLTGTDKSKNSRVQLRICLALAAAEKKPHDKELAIRIIDGLEAGDQVRWEGVGKFSYVLLTARARLRATADSAADLWKAFQDCLAADEQIGPQGGGVTNLDRVNHIYQLAHDILETYRTKAGKDRFIKGDKEVATFYHRAVEKLDAKDANRRIDWLSRYYAYRHSDEVCQDVLEVEKLADDFSKFLKTSWGELETDDIHGKGRRWFLAADKEAESLNRATLHRLSLRTLANRCLVDNKKAVLEEVKNLKFAAIDEAVKNAREALDIHKAGNLSIAEKEALFAILVQQRYAHTEVLQEFYGELDKFKAADKPKATAEYNRLFKNMLDFHEVLVVFLEKEKQGLPRAGEWMASAAQYMDAAAKSAQGAEKARLEALAKRMHQAARNHSD